MALSKCLNLPWLLLACMAAGVLFTALSAEPSAYDNACFLQFGTNIEPCYDYLQKGGETVPKVCCDAVKSNLKVFGKRTTVCDCIQDLVEGATEEQTDRFFALPGMCVDDSRLKFTRHTNCSLVE
ncbi:PREDICTED: non-specific lipid-transfer protein 1-like [Ipomoea nil]|uniref:non-specific lipid-transfer protein 1-like n=1 Tax=Ipomoea nil TaxID=35883 RepID=UPI000900D25F|nr:PREDICTED: non-specific lipid-transfer protein 1-like [Ipomoea nil]